MLFVTPDTTKPGQKSDGTRQGERRPCTATAFGNPTDEPIIFDRYCPAGRH